MKKIIIGTVAAIVVVGIGIGGYFYMNTTGIRGAQNTKKVQNVVARVDGKDISKKTVDAIRARIITTRNIDVTKLDAAGKEKLQKAALEATIGQRLIEDAVTKSGIVSTKEEIDAQIAVFKKQLNTPEKFTAELTKEGLTEKTLRERVSTDLASQKYFKKQFAGKTKPVTVKDITAAYKKATATAKTPPTLKAVEKQIKTALIQQQQQTLLGDLIKQLRAAAKIEIL